MAEAYAGEAVFRHEGSERTHHHDLQLAGFLALVAGFVNSAGFIFIGSFTSHVTGNVGRFADDLVSNLSAAPFALLLVAAYFAGTFVASMAIESNVVRARSRVYGGLLLLEAMLLVIFALLSSVMDTRNPRFHDVQAVLLCIAMGMQNSFVTRLSGAVVRTTHLTGVVTDLGIESARWFRLWRAQIAQRTKLRLVAGDAPAAAPLASRTHLLLMIVVTFLVGSVVGAVSAAHLGALALLVPSALLVAGSGYAFLAGRDLRLRRDVA